jgi:hypothetical protein
MRKRNDSVGNIDRTPRRCGDLPGHVAPRLQLSPIGRDVLNQPSHVGERG